MCIEDGCCVDDMFLSLCGYIEFKYLDLNIDELKKCDVVFFVILYCVVMKYVEELVVVNIKVIDFVVDFCL